MDFYNTLFNTDERGEPLSGRKDFVTLEDGRVIFIGGPAEGGGTSTVAMLDAGVVSGQDARTGQQVEGHEVPNTYRQVAKEFFENFDRYNTRNPLDTDTLYKAIEMVYEAKQRGNKLWDKLVETFGMSDAQALELIRIGKSWFKAERQRTPEEARMDRLLRTRDSTGRATPRKW